MTIDTDKTKVMIVKSKKIIYDTFIYEKNSLDEVPSYKSLGIDSHHKLNWNYIIEKMINGGWKNYYGLENNCKTTYLWIMEKKSHFLDSSHLCYFIWM